MSNQKVLNIAVMAHVDAGKTTLTEHFLYASGAIRTLGSVDKGSTNTDSLPMEKERGISIKASTTSFYWKDTKINLIDTPGHVDFSSEVERALCVVDVAILLVSAVEGVQAHTLSLWQALNQLKIPTLIYINKIDRQGADVDAVLAQLQRELNITTIPIYTAHEEGLPEANIQPVFTPACDDETKTPVIEQLVSLDEALMEAYFEGENISDDTLLNIIKTHTATQAIIPVYCGIAKNNIGVNELLDGIIRFSPEIPFPNTDTLAAYVYKLEHHKVHGAMAHVKVFSGQLSAKSVVYNHTQQLETKINQTKQFELTKYEDKDLQAGDIGIITGVLGTKAGDIIGTEKGIPKLPQLQVPVLTVQVIPDNDQDYNKLAEALQQIDREDPSLQFKWFKAEKELQLLLMGQMQVEVLTHMLLNRFGIAVEITPPQVVYKETIAKAAEGYVRYWMPKPCWAIMTFLIEPGAPNSGVIYSSIVPQNDVHIKYQNEVARTIPKALEQGIKGWEVTDVKITMIKGEDHNVHSRPGDFNLATPMGIMRALETGDTQLLEPILYYEITADESFLGKLTSEITTRRGLLDTTEFHEQQCTLKGTVPVATSMDLSIKLNTITSGKIRLLLQFHGYDRCPEGEGEIRPYKGVNPLDEAQWILHRRGAYKADERVI